MAKKSKFDIVASQYSKQDDDTPSADLKRIDLNTAENHNHFTY